MTITRNYRTIGITIALVFAGALALAGCASTADQTTASSTTTTSASSTPTVAPAAVSSTNATSDAANTAVTDMYYAMSTVVDRYQATGQSVSTTDLAGLTTAMDKATTDSNTVTSFLNAGEYNTAQRAALLDASHAGVGIATAVGAMRSDSVVADYWTQYSTAYADYLAAS